MNVTLWIFQVLFALHTAMGAVWNITNSEQTVPSLKALPHAVWLGLGVVEALCALGLILAAFSKPVHILVPVSAAVIVAEMLLFSGLHFSSGATNHGEVV